MPAAGSSPFSSSVGNPALLALERADRRLLWLFFGSSALIAALFGLLYAFDTAPVIAAHRGLLTGTCALLALAFAFGGWGATHGHASLAVQAVAWATLAGVGSTSAVVGQGLHALPLGFLAILVCMGCVLVGRRSGMALAAGSLLVLLALAAAQAQSGAGQPRFGASLPVVLATHLLLLAGGLVAGWVASRALEHALRAAREREQRLAGLLGIAVDWYWEQDEELRFTHSGGSASSHAGVDCLGRRRWEVEGLQLPAEQWEAHRADLAARRPFRDLVVRLPDVAGKPRWASVSGEPMFDAAGRFTGYWGVGHTVTADVLAQQALRLSESRYRELFARSPSPMLVHRHGVIIDANEAAMQLFGYADRAGMIGLNIVRHYPEGDARERVRERLAQVEMLSGGEQLPLADFKLERCDGRPIDVQVTTLRVQFDDNPATLSIYIDMTARKAAEQALRGSQRLLERLFDTTPDTVTLTELESGRYLMLNERFTEVLGWRLEEAIGRSASELGVWHRATDRERLVHELREHGLVREMSAVFKSKTGELVPLSVSAATFRQDGTDYLVLVARDMAVVEQARLEREAILSHASIGIAFTRNRRFVQVNPQFEQMFGWRADELLGQPGSVVWPSEADYAEMGAIAGPLLAAGQRFQIERQMRRRDGSLFWCHMAAQVVDPGDPSRGGTIWTGHDCTERRQAEQALAAARDAAEAASRAKSAFLANTSHEIRTPLNGLLGLARLAQAPGLDAGRRDQYLRQIFDSAQGLSAIISDILDFSKIEAGKLSVESVPFDLRETLGAACHAYRSLAEARGLSLELVIDADVPHTVRGDALRVRQILGNYLTNALKFTERGGVRVEVSRGEGDRLLLGVADSGCGIDPEIQARLFTPFTQADESITRRYGGTGLGLSICRELAALMHGEVGVESRPGRGARFWASLPLPAAAAIAPAPQDKALRARSLAGASVLLVEDNPVNMMIAGAMLEQWGVSVSHAADGQQALDAVAAAARAGRAFDAVLMDVQMPVMSGHEAARRLRLRWDREALPIVALTAAALVSEREQALEAGMDAFLTKPIDADELERVLAEVLDGRVAA